MTEHPLHMGHWTGCSGGADRCDPGPRGADSSASEAGIKHITEVKI